MAGLKPSLRTFLALGVIALHAILLPLLYFRLDSIVRQSHEDMFVNHVRAYTHMLTEEFEAGTLPATDQGLQLFLDSISLGGEVNYAEAVVDGRTLHSSLGSIVPSPPRVEDYHFGSGDDQTYFVFTLVNGSNRKVMLRLGFDEQPTTEHINEARRSLALALVSYLVAALLAGLLLSRLLIRPVHTLRAASRRIASGDVAERLEAHSHIREMNDLATDLETMRRELVGIGTRLEQQMAESAAMEARLRQKQRLETVGTLAGGVAHEINNVLLPIVLRAELAADSLPADHPAREDLEVVLAAAHRARSVVSKVLAFGRHFEAGPPSPINLAPAVEEGLRLFTALRPSNIEILADIRGNCSLVMAEHTLIVHIVMNLCTNAYQAMREAGGTLSLTLADVDLEEDLVDGVEAGTYVMLRVSDTGHGMDEKTRERIFEPFFTTRDVGEGTGLGLSVVHGMATRMGAIIQVDSEPGQGAAFTLLFPARDVQYSALAILQSEARD